MALAKTAVELFRSLDVTNIKLRRPSPFIFLCGGALAQPPAEAKSVREQVLRRCLSRERFNDKTRIILAEYVDQSFEETQFEDLLELEKYIAALSEAVVLIVEAPGAIAELGAFSQIDEIAERLFVVARAGLHPKPSFISRGPLRNLQKRFDAVSAYEWFETNHKFDGISPEVLSDLVYDVSQLSAARSKAEKFASDRVGHFLTLIAQVVYLNRCSTSIEIKEALKILGISTRGKNVDLCLNALRIVGWIRQEQERKGRYWVARSDFVASDFAYRPGARNETIRWISDIAAEYKHLNDPRHRLFSRLLEEEPNALVA